jgi:hypothetical protein
MKTSVEINGYVISIEEKEGIISVNAVKDDEVIEEFSIETEEAQSEGGEGFDDEEVKGFGDYAQEEDFEDEIQGQDDDEEEFEGQDDDEDDDEEEKPQGAALESFQSFINKRK